MIHFFIGTKAQLIKMAPLMIEMRQSNIPFRHIDSGQHAEITQSLRKVFDLPEPDISLRPESGDIVKIGGAVTWYLGLWRNTLLGRRWLREQVFPGGGICLVHGDTLSTLLGVQLARSIGVKVAHVEAGLRSFRWWDPFPEEIIRIYCMKRADVLFSPSAEATGNLRQMHVPGDVVSLSGNTVVDALRLVDQCEIGDLPVEPYVLATCHRLETISNRGKLEKVVAILNRTSEKWPVVFVTHRPTRRYLEKFGLAQRLAQGVECRDMQDYATFVTLLKRAHCVLTDGGSIQEECGYLNKPCLILRNATERSDGLGKNATLWQFDEQIATAFLDNVDGQDPAKLADGPSPSREIVARLCELGYAE